MPIISSVIKGIFGDKSVKDRKLIWPIVEEINEFQKSNKSNRKLILKYNFFLF